MRKTSRNSTRGCSKTVRATNPRRIGTLALDCGKRRSLRACCPIIDRRQRQDERLRDEHGYAGGYTAVKDYVRLTRSRSREMFGAARSPAGPCAGRFRRVRRRHRRRADEAACVLLRAAAIGRLFSEVLCGGDDGGVSRRPCLRLWLLWRGPAVDPVRQHQTRGGFLGDGERRRTQAFTEFVSHFLALGAVRGRTLARQSAEPRMDAGMPDSKRQLPVHTSDLPEVHEAVADPPGERGPFSTVLSTSPRTMWSISSSAKTEVSMGALARVSHELNN